ncbi:MAG: dTMP kinase [Propionibacteriaceae bacterium]|jgi:dTMP kinase|nr:dTMP kinase [Propionibacteriaceae bacterium]
MFIVFEGGDGVGKSTQANALADWLRGQGREVVLTFEPGDTPAGAHIREILLDPATGELPPSAEALLYVADKAIHVEQVIRPALARGAVVICDRYVDSMLAYQGAGRILDISELESLAAWATGGLRPDLTVLLDLDPAEAMAEIETPDRLEAEGADFHQRVREHYLALADKPGYVVIPARLPADEIAARVRAALG